MSAFDEIAGNAWPAVLRPEIGDARYLVLVLHAEVLTELLEAGAADPVLQAQCQHDAAGMLDAMQAWLDATDRNTPSRRIVIYVMIRLAASSKRFPSSLYVHDVDIGQVRDPTRLGGYADIFEAGHRGRPVALKRLRALTTLTSDLHKNLCREALVWRQLKHPFILPFIGIDDNTFASAGFISLVSPWMCRGTLRQYMDTPDYETGRDMHRLLVEVAEGLEYLHAQKVVHGDIKDLNILLNDECHVQLCDFGLVIVGDATEGRMTTSARGVGSGTWQSPERFMAERHRRSMADDVYAFGCLAYYLLTRHPPFHEVNEVGAAMKIVSGQRPTRPATILCSDALWTLVTDCWSHDPRCRPTMTAVLSSCRPLCLETECFTTEDPELSVADSGYSGSPRAAQLRRRVVGMADLSWLTLLCTVPDAGMRKSRKVRRALLEGVPSSVRSVVWAGLLNISARRVEGVYEQLNTRRCVPATPEIERDLRTSFADQPVFADPAGPLASLLQAYLKMATDVHYHHGLALVGGCLLDQGSEEDAFWMFASVLDTHLRPYFSANPLQLEIDATLFSKALEVNDPALAKKLFVQLQLSPAAVCTPWFTSIFATALPKNFVVRVWDIFLFEGMMFLFRVGLALVYCCRKQLLKAHDAPSALAMLASPPPGCLPVDADVFIRLAHAARLKEPDVLKQRVKMKARLRQVALPRPPPPIGSPPPIPVRQGERF